MANSKMYCNVCGIPMFAYKIKHNGVDEVVYRCMGAHGNKRSKDGKLRWANGGRQPYGIKQVFKHLYKVR